jgi:hypothetical protein
VLLQPDWMRHLRRLSALTRLYPARLFDQEVRHPLLCLLCFALLCFALVSCTKKEEMKVWPIISLHSANTHNTQPHCTLADVATSATGHPVHVSVNL